MLVNESEIISTGVLKLDIYEESDRSALEAQSASEAQSQMLQQTINKQVKLFEVLQDEHGNEKVKGSSIEVGHLFFALTFKIGSFDFQVF